MSQLLRSLIFDHSLSSLEKHSPVPINLIHTSGSILTPMLNAIVDICAAVWTGPTRCADAGVAAGIIHNAASSVGTRLLEEDEDAR